MILQYPLVSLIPLNFPKSFVSSGISKQQRDFEKKAMNTIFESFNKDLLK